MWQPIVDGRRRWATAGHGPIYGPETEHALWPVRNPGVAVFVGAIRRRRSAAAAERE